MNHSKELNPRMPTPWNRSKPSWGSKNKLMDRKRKHGVALLLGTAHPGCGRAPSQPTGVAEKPVFGLKSGYEVFVTPGRLACLPLHNMPLIYFYA